MAGEGGAGTAGGDARRAAVPTGMDPAHARAGRAEVGWGGCLPRSRGSDAGRPRPPGRETFLRRLALVVLAAVLAACAGQGSPRPTPTSSPCRSPVPGVGLGAQGPAR